MKYVFLALTMLLHGAFITRMFGGLKGIIPNDTIFVSVLVAACLTTLATFWAHEKSQRPVHPYLREQRDKAMNSARTGMLLCAIVLVFLLTSLL